MSRTLEVKTNVCVLILYVQHNVIQYNTETHLSTVAFNLYDIIT